MSSTKNPSLLYFDPHCHLDDAAFDADREKVISSFSSRRIIGVLNAGNSLETTESSIKLSAAHSKIYASAGIHPHCADAPGDNWQSKLRGFASDPKVRAIGEAGLDYFKSGTDKKSQRSLFEFQTELASTTGLPLIVHCRDAYEDTYDILKNNMPESGGVMHCFSGNYRQASLFADLGFYISAAGNITYKKSEIKEVFRKLPLRLIMAETDSPYLAPVPLRGKRNEPAFLRETIIFLAEVCNKTPEEIAAASTENVMKLFAIKGENNPQIIYRYNNSIYINLTSRCTNRCSFCKRTSGSYNFGEYNLKLTEEPSFEEIKAELEKQHNFNEAVFCGFGEPTLRLDALRKTALYLKSRNKKVRLNTNGLGSLTNGRDITEDISDCIDEVSVSLNGSDPGKYNILCRPETGPESYKAVLEFIKGCSGKIPLVTASAVQMPGVDIEQCRRTAESLGAVFRARPYISFKEEESE
ncbi:MAG: YchF/TatD family DNA exonuclease [Fibrobacterota bacterium]